MDKEKMYDLKTTVNNWIMTRYIIFVLYIHLVFDALFKCKCYWISYLINHSLIENNTE